jgi:hypothetical protein
MNRHPQTSGIYATFSDLVSRYLIVVAAAGVIIWILASAGIDPRILDEAGREAAPAGTAPTQFGQIAHSSLD